MILFTPLRPDPGAPLARANPVAKLGAAAVILAALFVSVDLVTPAIVVAGVLASVALTGLPARTLLARTWPILVAALSVGVLNVLFAGDLRGELLFRLGPVSVGAGNLQSGAGLGLRLLGIAGAGVLALVTTEPTRLADGLQQQLRLSPRFAVGALAAVRLLPILAVEWQTLRLARRARGVSAGRSPVAAVRIWLGQLLALLVAAVRRGTRLATAMEARGFGSRACRGVARPQQMRPADWWLLAAAALLGVGAIAISIALGSWRFLFG
jgi:energy-coupling factor transport system permease protein